MGYENELRSDAIWLNGVATRHCSKQCRLSLGTASTLQSLIRDRGPEISLFSSPRAATCLLSGMSRNAKSSTTARDEIANVYSNAEIKVVADILGGAAEYEDGQ
jgi:hypothetical protein